VEAPEAASDKQALRYALLGELQAAFDCILLLPPQDQIPAVVEIWTTLRSSWSPRSARWLQLIATSSLRAAYFEHVGRSLPESSEYKTLLCAVAEETHSLDIALAAAAITSVHQDSDTMMADPFLAYIASDDLRHETALECVNIIIAAGSDKWAFKFAMRLGDEMSRALCACMAIAYIVERGVRPFAEECETMLRAQTPGRAPLIDELLIKALLQRGGINLVERWTSWKCEKHGEVLRSLKASDPVRPVLTKERPDTEWLVPSILGLCLALWLLVFVSRPVFGTYTFESFFETPHQYQTSFDGVLTEEGFSIRPTSVPVGAHVTRNGLGCNHGDQTCTRLTQIGFADGSVADVEGGCVVSNGQYHCASKRWDESRDDVIDGDVDLVAVSRNAAPILSHVVNADGPLADRVMDTLLNAFGATLCLVVALYILRSLRTVSAAKRLKMSLAELLTSWTQMAAASVGVLALIILTIETIVVGISYWWPIPSIIVGPHFVIWP
jgi:hypothetical protein